MTERAYMDRPAAVLAVAAGVILVAASLPFAVLSLPEQPKEYLVGWSDREAMAATVAVAEPGSAQGVAQVTVTGHLSNVTVTLAAGACTDQFDPSDEYGQQPATFTWSLVARINGTEETLDGTAPGETLTCADVAGGLTVRHAIGTHPDIGSLEAMDMAKAIQRFEYETKEESRNATYVLSVAWSRAPAQPAAGPLPLPIPLPNTPQTSFSLQMDLVATTWGATIVEKPEEIK